MMANTKISQAYSKPTLDPTDMIPVAAQGQLTAYHVTGQALFDSLPAATTASRGVVELATAAEAKAATDTERAVTPASLLGALGPKHIGSAILFIGSPAALTAVAIGDAFVTAVGRQPLHGDLVVFSGPYPVYGFYFGLYSSGVGAFYCVNMHDGSFDCYE
jgi:hypothetical protein